MGIAKRISRSFFVQETLGFLVARYLGLVRLANRFTIEPTEPYTEIGPHMPVIAAMWHGQHFMIHFARRAGDRAASLVSRSADGDLNACVLKHVGVRAIRGSGARGRNIKEKGGVTATLAMKRALDDGEMVVMTADVPKTSRICGPGIVMLAQVSGRPIVPIAVVTSRRIDFKSWDRASIGLPFGKGAMVYGAPIFVSRDADDDGKEAARCAVEAELDRVHARAYELVGSRDPGAKDPGIEDFEVQPQIPGRASRSGGERGAA